MSFDQKLICFIFRFSSEMMQTTAPNETAVFDKYCYALFTKFILSTILCESTRTRVHRKLSTVRPYSTLLFALLVVTLLEWL